jgi:uncharacterized protein
MDPALVVPLAVGGAGVAGVGYAWGIERKHFRLRRCDVPVLRPGSDPLRLLHISDMHVTPSQRWKIEWVRSLAELRPDLVIDTGDNIAHREAVPSTVRALEPLFAFPGVFVPGSNDFFAPTPKNPARYLMRDTGKRYHGDRLPYGDLRLAMREAGWTDVTHQRELLLLGGRRVEVSGVSDPHLKADHYDRVEGPASSEAEVSLGLSHSPEPRVLDAYADDGFALVFSGHTHGGQLRVPGIGALVTNCGLDRRKARGLSTYEHDGHSMFIHVSAGIGTSPYAPVRFACPPEATLLTLVAAR